MRLARIKNGNKGGGFCHVMSRVVDGRYIFNVKSAACVEAAYFLHLMRKLEAFHGMKVVTYALLSDHFHILVREPLVRLLTISDEELCARVAVCNGKSAGHELRWQLNHLRTELKAPEAAEALKQKYLKRMGNISDFVKELKGRFAQWYNKRHGRYGVLWAERFKSVLVEGETALWTMAAYIDLNCVRAGLVEDPKDYRWCGYGEAISGGSKIARDKLKEVFAGCNEQIAWKTFASEYRKLLFSEGEQRVPEPGKRVRKGISAKRVQEVLEGDGELTLGELVRCRVRYFTDGLVLGSAQFVERIFEENRQLFGAKRETGARKMAGSNLAGLRTLRDLRRQPIGS